MEKYNPDKSKIVPRDHADNYDEDHSLLNVDSTLLDASRRAQNVDNYDEKTSRIPADKDMKYNPYDSESSLIEPKEYSHADAYGEESSFFEEIGNRITDFVQDTGEYYEHLVLAEIEYYKLKALNLINDYAAYYAIELPTKFVKDFINNTKSTEPAPQTKVYPIGYTDDAPYEGEGIIDESYTKAKYVHGTIYEVKPDAYGTQRTITNENRMAYTSSYRQEEAQSKLKKSTFDFRILNLASGKEERFPAYIRNFNESVSSSWNSTALINHTENAYVYQNADRSFTLDFAVLATQEEDGTENKEEYTVYTTNGTSTLQVIGKKDMWRKMNFLHSLTRPAYTSNGLYDKSPFCKIWIADLIKGQHAIVDGVSINYDPLLWDLNDGDIKPMIAIITLSGKLLHSVQPSVNHIYYY